MASKEELIMKIQNKSWKKAMVMAGALAFGGLLLPSAYAADDNTGASMSRGVKEWNDNCARCHNVRDPKEMRDDQWMATVFHMRVRAGLTGQEARDILLFLQNTN